MSDKVLLPGGWRLWNQFALRGPGFPAAGVLRLAPAGLAAAADKVAEAPPTGPEWDGFEEFFGTAAVATAETLQEIAARPAFQAAVGWQNRAVLGSGIRPFLSWRPSVAGRTSMPRQREELVAHYWQRFCVKNDTIGFFGPVGWGRIDPALPGLQVEPGERLIAESEVYFSSWAIDTLARTIEDTPGMRAWIPPRRVSFARLTERGVELAGCPPQPVDAADRRVLELCDGTRDPAAIAAATGRPPAEVLAVLAAMVRRRWIVWRIEIPASAHPDRYLRAALERVPDARVRADALDRLAVLERGRERVRAAGQDPAALIDALGALEASFVELTDASAQRAKGAKTAPCRALTYSDSRRSATVRVGAAVLAELTPLSFCLLAARWLVDRFGEVAEGRIRERYEQLRDQQGTVDLASLWMRCMPNPYPGAPEDAERIRQEMQRRWAAIVDAPPGASRVRLRSADIADRVRAAFGGPGRGWGMARYVSPDVFVLATDAAAVARGELELVLGEMHVGTNTLTQSLFVMQHPDAGELLAETDRDFPGPRLMPMLPKESKLLRWSTRSRPALTRAQDYLVGLVDYTADPHRPRTVPGGDVQVRERDGELVVVLPDGATFGLLEVFGHALTNQVMNRFALQPDVGHTPRVTVDRMVLSRETWRFAAGTLDFAAQKSEARRFVAARRWRAEQDLPRFAFVVSPAEPRPFYVDFDSPVYVNILAKAIRRLRTADPAAVLTVSEMLPTPEQAWLTDERGERYCSELRLVAVDQTREEFL
ncbi:lantibiotic dehydratase [Plantactinospora sp. KBS50]|uniref:lantibiotic dehydratase n=1 Tax=Plantactinospora sp. KBS50 TaxID=2024580 RepID=UPI000BAAFD3F|nr:lantibiotic dehydratase [Plantactinospora sp. KBS50]ASW55435.1 lantibiotic dehydratase [Plantactinospora sp. KBS50]